MYFEDKFHVLQALNSTNSCRWVDTRYIPTTTSIVCLDIIMVKGGVNTQESL